MAIMTGMRLQLTAMQAQRLRWQNVLQIIDLVATDQLIMGKKNSLDTQQQYYTEGIRKLLVLLAGLCSVIINL
jgi:hypothetical protein